MSEPSEQQLDLLLVDGRHLLWRSASVFMELAAEDHDGNRMLTGGIYGFLRISLAAWLRFGGITMVAWDRAEGPTERRRIFAEYKHRAPSKKSSRTPQVIRPNAHAVEREVMLEQMRGQEAELKDRLLPQLGIRQASSPGWEADDTIATLCRRFDGSRIGVLSGDRDLLQLVTDTTTLLRPLPQSKFSHDTPSSVQAEFGVSPEQILDLKTLAGDPGDNVPGARGIGPKTAAKLITTHGGWQQALDAALGDKSNDKTMARLREHEDNIRMSAKLVQLNQRAPMEFIESARDKRAVYARMMELQFQSLVGGRMEHFLMMGGDT